MHTLTTGSARGLASDSSVHVSPVRNLSVPQLGLTSCEKAYQSWGRLLVVKHQNGPQRWNSINGDK